MHSRFVRALLLSLLTLAALPVASYASTAAPAVGGGSAFNLWSCQYNATLPTLMNGQNGIVQCDSLNRVITAPQSLLFSSALQTYPATGVGADTVFPGSVSTSGTSLGVLPTGASKIRIHIPIGASVTGYVAAAQASSAAAAALVARTYNNASANTNNLDLDVDLNGMQFWVTNYTSGSSTTYTSGSPVFRFI